MRNLYDRLHDKVLIKYVKNPMTEVTPKIMCLNIKKKFMMLQ
ncbi:hypothetical protein Si099_00293 [Streptococcus infantarius subsp. infantarius]|nr:hypothetical protein [Streptococcus infantarius subsp. infantarius]